MMSDGSEGTVVLWPVSDGSESAVVRGREEQYLVESATVLRPMCSSSHIWSDTILRSLC